MVAMVNQQRVAVEGFQMIGGRAQRGGGERLGRHRAADDDRPAQQNDNEPKPCQCRAQHDFVMRAAKRR